MEIMKGSFVSDGEIENGYKTYLRVDESDQEMGTPAISELATAACVGGRGEGDLGSKRGRRSRLSVHLDFWWREIRTGLGWMRGSSGGN